MLFNLPPIAIPMLFAPGTALYFAYVETEPHLPIRQKPHLTERERDAMELYDPTPGTLARLTIYQFSSFCMHADSHLIEFSRGRRFDR